MQLYRWIGELGEGMKIPLGFSELNFKTLDKGTLFSDVLAARAEEVVRENDSPLPHQTAPQGKVDQGVAGVVSQEAGKFHQNPEEIILDPEQEPRVAELLQKLGFNEAEIKEALDQAKDPDTGGIRLASIIDSIKKHSPEQEGDQTLTLPAGTAPQLLVLAEKMGLDQDALEKLAQDLGTGTISLKKLVSALKEINNAEKPLEKEDLESVKEILLQMGVSPEKAESLIKENLNAQGGLSLQGLTAMLEEIVQENDKTATLLSSGKLGAMVAKLLEGAKVEVQPQPEVKLSTESLVNQLNRLETDQKRQVANKKKAKADAHKPGAEDTGLTEEAEESEGLNLKALGKILGKPEKGGSSPDAPALAKAKSGAAPKMEADAEPVQAVSPEKTADPSPEKSALAAKTATVKTAQAQAAQTQNPGPARGADQVNLSSTTATAPTNQAQSVQAAVKAGPARMTPSVMLEQLSGRMVMMVRNGETSMRLHLHPKDLGSVRIDLRVEGTSVRATIVAENQQVQQMLGSNSSELRQSLADQGFNLDKFEVMTQSQFQQAGNGEQGSGKEPGNNGFEKSTGGEGGNSMPEESQAAIRAQYYRTGQVDLVA